MEIIHSLHQNLHRKPVHDTEERMNLKLVNHIPYTIQPAERLTQLDAIYTPWGIYMPVHPIMESIQNYSQTGMIFQRERQKSVTRWSSSIVASMRSTGMNSTSKSACITIGGDTVRGSWPIVNPRDTFCWTHIRNSCHLLPREKTQKPTSAREIMFIGNTVSAEPEDEICT